MKQYGIALDLGTSGIRAQAVDLDEGNVISAVISTNHPLPGFNVTDHLHFALESGGENAQNIIIRAINQIIEGLAIPQSNIIKLAVCGNPIQLALFQGTEIRDLAFSGIEKLRSMNVEVQHRDAQILSASCFPNLQLPPNCKIIIPPAVCHEVGADAIALILQTEMHKHEETSIAIDFGTNAEIVLFHNGILKSASAAAGAAIEGKQIQCGMLAAPGAISDIEHTMDGYQLTVLNSDMLPEKGRIINFSYPGNDLESNTELLPIGITGTGTVAIMKEAMGNGLISLPDICTEDKMLHLGKDIFFTNNDVKEAGKAFGAIRAGYFTLCQDAGISVEDVQIIYMAGASGTYVDPVKAQKVGLIPPAVEKVVRAGNTSLAMARQLVIDETHLDEMTRMANDMRKNYFSLAASEIFKKVFILELSYWLEGMPMTIYRNLLKVYRFRDMPEIQGKLNIVNDFNKDSGITTYTNSITIRKNEDVEISGCTLCMKCQAGCPVNAISVRASPLSPAISVDGSLCLGITCKRCERACLENVFKLLDFFN